MLFVIDAMIYVSRSNVQESALPSFEVQVGISFKSCPLYRTFSVYKMERIFGVNVGAYSVTYSSSRLVPVSPVCSKQRGSL